MKYNKLVAVAALASTTQALDTEQKITVNSLQQASANANNKNAASQQIKSGTKTLTDLESGLDSESLESTKAEVMAKWGFLKNIVNIDRFFASAEGDAEKAAPVTQSDEVADA